MFDVERIALVGSTGLIGRKVLETSIGREDMRITAVARREYPLPKGARMEMFVADADKWGEVFEAVKPMALICALGTTMRKVDGDEEQFYAVDHDLVLQTAEAAQAAGVKRFVTITSVGANPISKNFYLKTKGEVEKSLMKMKFERLDIVRPGLLLGMRQGDLRPAEQVGQIVAPLANLFMHGGSRKYRAIRSQRVAEACLALAMRKARGRFRHEHDAIMRVAKSLPVPEAD